MRNDARVKTRSEGKRHMNKYILKTLSWRKKKVRSEGREPRQHTLGNGFIFPFNTECFILINNVRVEY